MDADLGFWAARKRNLLNASHFLLDRQLNAEDLELEDELRAEFSCPYCSEDMDISSLCSHIEDEHCYDGRLVMCPVCAVKVGGDIVGHITTHHPYLFKAQCRRRFRRPRDMTSARLQALLGGRSTSTTSDSFLSSLVAGFPFSETEDGAKPVLDSLEKCTASSALPEKPHPSAEETTLTREERERRTKQASSRAQFVQHLVLSTLWPEEM